ncbi:hypothetical protein K7640_01110 [Micromonospora sp. PLK6-60]|uniref:hypothetical protein n=1 Tax=Micromonospora sp. PLK6-60 TaxID=2873383 RepID=UPI001CA6EC09|nr:hypothetical protein [Micromonospora sp. PLK6-60]MBY8870439.1 hypothetical protein [Micromonospora sp. PLK6-60]
MATGEARAARVTRTGLALVHAGELVLPAAGSEAEAERVAEDDRATISYHFPVEIEVVAAGVELDPDALADLALSRLAEHLEGRV